MPLGLTPGQMSLTSAVPCDVPSVRQSSGPSAPSSGTKYPNPPASVNPGGPFDVFANVFSETVPAAVPSVFQIDGPLPRFGTARTIPPWSASGVPSHQSVSTDVPASVPSLLYRGGGPNDIGGNGPWKSRTPSSVEKPEESTPGGKAPLGVENVSIGFVPPFVPSEVQRLPPDAKRRVA